MTSNVLFTRRITHHGIQTSHNAGFRRGAYVYFMDAEKLDDIVDFWNLRAMGKKVIPLPKQLKDHPKIREFLIDFLRKHRRHLKYNPKLCDTASIIRARNCTMKEIEAYAKTLKIRHNPKDTSADGFFVLQHWYPRVWDEWARDKDGAVPEDMYGNEEDSREVSDTKDRKIRFSPHWFIQ